MRPNPHETLDLVTFTEEIRKRKTFFCALLELYNVLIYVVFASSKAELDIKQNKFYEWES